MSAITAKFLHLSRRYLWMCEDSVFFGCDCSAPDLPR